MINGLCTLQTQIFVRRNIYIKDPTHVKSRVRPDDQQVERMLQFRCFTFQCFSFSLYAVTDRKHWRYVWCFKKLGNITCLWRQQNGINILSCSVWQIAMLHHLQVIKRQHVWTSQMRVFFHVGLTEVWSHLWWWTSQSTNALNFQLIFRGYAVWTSAWKLTSLTGCLSPTYTSSLLMVL